MKRILLFTACVVVLLAALGAPLAADAPLFPRRAPLPLKSARMLNLTPGWNLIGWTGDTCAVEEGLAAIDGCWDMAYGYDAFNPDDPWLFYDRTLPEFPPTLLYLEHGRGYWLRVTCPCALGL